MPRTPLSPACLLAALGLTACASSGGLSDGPADPILDGGAVAPQRNLLVRNIGFNSNGFGQALPETFDLGTTSTVTRPDDASGGLVEIERTQTLQGSGDTMTFTGGRAADGSRQSTFAFDVRTESGAFAGVVPNVMVDNPDDLGLRNNALVVLYAARPERFDALLRDAGLAPPADTRFDTLEAYFRVIEEGDTDAEMELFAALERRRDQILGPDEFLYILPDGTAYRQTKMSGDVRHVAIASWQTPQADGTLFEGHAVFGARTPDTEIPVSGQIAYNGKVVGSVLTNNAVRSLTGSFDMNADFATSEVMVGMTTMIREVSDTGVTTFIPYRDFEGEGRVSSSTFAGTLTEANGGDGTGGFEGAFYGARGNEVGGTFGFEDTSTYAHGAFVAAETTGN